MSPEPGTAPAEESGVEPGAYNDFVASLHLANISVVKVAGERRADGAAIQTRFEMSAGYQVEDRKVHYRFDVVGHLVGNDEADVGTVHASVIVSLESSSELPDHACLVRFGGTSATMMSHPYLREALASTALRLGFQGVLLPIMTQLPNAVSDTEAQSPA